MSGPSSAGSLRGPNFYGLIQYRRWVDKHIRQDPQTASDYEGFKTSFEKVGLESRYTTVPPTKAFAAFAFSKKIHSTATHIEQCLKEALPPRPYSLEEFQSSVEHSGWDLQEQEEYLELIRQALDSGIVTLSPTRSLNFYRSLILQGPFSQREGSRIDSCFEPREEGAFPDHSQEKAEAFLSTLPEGEKLELSREVDAFKKAVSEKCKEDQKLKLSPEALWRVFLQEKQTRKLREEQKKMFLKALKSHPTTHDCSGLDDYAWAGERRFYEPLFRDSIQGIFSRKVISRWAHYARNKETASEKTWPILWPRQDAWQSFLSDDDDGGEVELYDGMGTQI